MSAKKGMINVCRDIAGILEQINPEDYTAPLDLFNGASLGQHFRHVLDFFQCLALAGETGIVDYARRKRDPRIEADPIYAASAFQKILAQVEQMDEGTVLYMRADFMNVPEEDRPLYASSVGREMTFVHDHAIHHLAMINIGIQEQCPYIAKPKHFGVAPSTIKHRIAQP